MTNVGGRPSKLDADVKKQLVDAISAGNYIEVACEHAGITKRTFYTWLEKGEIARSGEYREFYLEIQEAQANLEVALVAQWMQNVKKDWRAAAEMLSRRFPDRWSPTRYMKQEISGPDQSPLRIYTLDIGGELADDNYANEAITSG